jgi:hypothetical protein
MDKNKLHEIETKLNPKTNGFCLFKEEAGRTYSTAGFGDAGLEATDNISENLNSGNTKNYEIQEVSPYEESDWLISESIKDEKKKIDEWLKTTTEPYDDWHWDGLDLTILKEQKVVEIISRKILSDNNIVDQELKPNTNVRNKYGCLMSYFDIPLWDQITSMIDPDDIYTEDDNFGIENEPHTTVLFGFKDDEVNLDTIKNDLKDITEVPITINRIYHFNGSDTNKPYDVVKFDIDSPILHQLNGLMKKYPNENEFPEYHPHMTIGYVKAGLGQKYDGNLIKQPEIVSKRMVYSHPTGKKDIWELPIQPDVYNSKEEMMAQSEMNEVSPYEESDWLQDPPVNEGLNLRKKPKHKSVVPSEQVWRILNNAYPEYDVQVANGYPVNWDVIDIYPKNYGEHDYSFHIYPNNPTQHEYAPTFHVQMVQDGNTIEVNDIPRTVLGLTGTLSVWMKDKINEHRRFNEGLNLQKKPKYKNKMTYLMAIGINEKFKLTDVDEIIEYLENYYEFDLTGLDVEYIDLDGRTKSGKLSMFIEIYFHIGEDIFYLSEDLTLLYVNQYNVVSVQSESDENYNINAEDPDSIGRIQDLFFKHDVRSITALPTYATTETPSPFPIDFFYDVYSIVSIKEKLYKISEPYVIEPLSVTPDTSILHEGLNLKKKEKAKHPITQIVEILNKDIHIMNPDDIAEWIQTEVDEENIKETQAVYIDRWGNFQTTNLINFADTYFIIGGYFNYLFPDGSIPSALSYKIIGIRDTDKSADQYISDLKEINKLLQSDSTETIVVGVIEDNGNLQDMDLSEFDTPGVISLLNGTYYLFNGDKFFPAPVDIDPNTNNTEIKEDDIHGMNDASSEMSLDRFMTVK